MKQLTTITTATSGAFNFLKSKPVQNDECNIKCYNIGICLIYVHSMLDLLKIKAMFSGISKFISKSL